MIMVGIPIGTEIGYLDRDGVDNGCGRQGFILTIGEIEFHFGDEEIAEEIAIRIAKRLGYICEWSGPPNSKEAKCSELIRSVPAAPPA